MVRTQIEGRGITGSEIIRAFLAVPREEFVIAPYKERAYEDNEAPIGYEQSLDRPYENALMIHALNIRPASRVLEVGTGSGYLASLIAQIAKEVYTIEIVPEIADMARGHIARLGYDNIIVKTGDGFIGWPEHAPFDAIVMTASPNRVPKPLEEQLAEGGRIVLPMGGTEKFQLLVLFEKKGGKLVERAKLMPAVFVPMQGIILDRGEQR
ncbi:MAG: protein-L-isoaspartate(D-aspartate) O-methyltransferase [Proteobacteria bacterium]|nr:protein-L-isoaspartate(D-aspartate) O-methyltransferase [Pseudomonadota bacterium]